jgi:hypothetical protein
MHDCHNNKKNHSIASNSDFPSFMSAICDGDDGCQRPVAFHCATCGGHLCVECDKSIHKSKLTSKHERIPFVTTLLCEGNDGCVQPAVVSCAKCGGNLCVECDTSMHRSRLTSNHPRVPLASSAPYLVKVRAMVPTVCSQHDPCAAKCLPHGGYIQCTMC